MIACHEVKEGCKCKKRCSAKINNSLRHKINEKYWNKDFTGQKAFLSHYIECGNMKKRRQMKNEENYRKNVSRTYFFKGENGSRI